MQGRADNQAVRGLSREFVIKSILHILDTASAEKRWGSVMVQFQAGVCRCIKEEKTTVTEGEGKRDPTKNTEADAPCGGGEIKPISDCIA